MEQPNQNSLTQTMLGESFYEPKVLTCEQQKRFLILKQHAALNILAYINVCLHEDIVVYDVWKELQDSLTYCPEPKLPHDRRNRPIMPALAWQMRCDTIQAMITKLQSEKSAVWLINYKHDCYDGKEMSDLAMLADMEVIIMKCCTDFDTLWQHKSAETKELVAYWSSNATPIFNISKEIKNYLIV